jgi:hypothetical protein
MSTSTYVNVNVFNARPQAVHGRSLAPTYAGYSVTKSLIATPARAMKTIDLGSTATGRARPSGGLARSL